MRTLFLFALSALLLGCSQDGAAKAAPAPKKPSPPVEEKVVKQVSLEEAQRSLPGFPMESVSSTLRGRLISLAEDEFVHDGSPFTLAGCIRDDRPCKGAAIRGLTLLQLFLEGGAKDGEALGTYNRYYRSFGNRQEIDLTDSACMGPENAPITTVVFSDFECPYCGAARPMLEGLVKSRDDVKLCFMHFPLPGHPHAMSAAQATAFAHKHGKFWELHDLIFDNQRRLSDQTIRSLVSRVGLNFDELAKGIGSGELAKIVERQKAEGLRLGIQGTPSIYINGRKVELPLDPRLLAFTVEDEVQWQAGGGKWSAAQP